MLTLSGYKFHKLWIIVAVIGLAIAACTPVTNQELDLISEELTTSEELVSTLESKLSVAQLEIEHLTTAEEHLIKEMATRNETILELTTNLDARLDTVDDYQKDKLELTKDITKALTTIEQLTAELKTVSATKTTLEEQLSDNKQISETFLKKNQELTSEVDDLLHSLTDLEDQYSRDSYRTGTQLAVTEANLQYTLKQVQDVKLLLLLWETIFTLRGDANIMDIDNMDIATMSILSRITKNVPQDYDSYVGSISDDTLRQRYETFLTDAPNLSPMKRAALISQLFKQAYGILLFPWDP